MSENTQQPQAAEPQEFESLEDVGGYIVKNANANLYDPSETEEQEEEQTTDAADADEPDLSIFDGIDSEAPATEKPAADEDKTPPGFEKFSQDFKEYLGFDIKDAMAAVQELQTLRNDIAIREQEASIKTSWAVDDTTYKARMNEVREYASAIQKKNPSMFEKLDNPEGVKLIWAKLESEKRKGNKTQVPGIQTTGNKTPAGARSAFDFTASQLQKMSRDEYAKNARRIERAYVEGRVDLRK